MTAPTARTAIVTVPLEHDPAPARYAGTPGWLDEHDLTLRATEAAARAMNVSPADVALTVAPRRGLILQGHFVAVTGDTDSVALATHAEFVFEFAPDVAKVA